MQEGEASLHMHFHFLQVKREESHFSLNRLLTAWSSPNPLLSYGPSTHLKDGGALLTALPARAEPPHHLPSAAASVICDGVVSPAPVEQ